MNKEFERSEYRHLMQVRALQPEEESNSTDMILEGKAVSFNDETVLFKLDNVEYKEVIERGAFDGCEMKYAFLKYNHSDNIMAMARTKNQTLEITIKDDGVYIRAKLANTTAGRDLYELVKRGDIDKMSFAFRIQEEAYDEENHKWTIRKISELYDVAAVTIPAYENTSIYARRYGEVEARVAKVEALKLANLNLAKLKAKAKLSTED